jgi:AraC-like DNA-binding protein
VPDGCAELVLSRADPFEHRAADGTVRRQPAAMWVGQITGSIHLRSTGEVDLIGIRLRPEGPRTFTDIAHDELTDEWVEMAALDHAPLRALAGARNVDVPEPGLLALVFSALRHARRGSVDARVARVCRLLEGNPGRYTVEGLAREACASTRTLERLFLRDVGLTPKRLSRIRRLQGVLRLRERGLSTLRAALACGYYDLAHLSRDFREFTGTSPACFFDLDPESLAHTFIDTPRA